MLSSAQGAGSAGKRESRAAACAGEGDEGVSEGAVEVGAACGGGGAKASTSRALGSRER